MKLTEVDRQFIISLLKILEVLKSKLQTLLN